MKQQNKRHGKTRQEKRADTCQKGEDTRNAGTHSFYNGVTALGGHKAFHGACVAFGTLVQLILEGAVKELFDEVQSFCMEVGLPVTLEELSLTRNEKELRTIVQNTCAEGETIHNLARDVTPDELYAAIIVADELGMAAKKNKQHSRLFRRRVGFLAFFTERRWCCYETVYRRIRDGN